jgi:hypothetical protein
MHDYILKEVGTPCRDPEGHIWEPFSFAAFGILLFWPACQVLFCWDHAFSGCITRCFFTSSKTLAYPVDPKRSTCGPFSFEASSLLLSWPACQISFYWDRAFSGYITRWTFTSSRKLACLVDTSRGPYVDPSHLQLLAFLYFDLPAKIHFVGTVNSVAAPQDALLHPPRGWHTL